MTFKVPSPLLITGSPALFDNSTRIASSAFVQRASGCLSTASYLALNTTLTAADVGKIFTCAGGITITLPLRSSLPSGARIEIRNIGSTPSTVQVNVADTLLVGTSSLLTSISVPSTSSVVLTAGLSTINWHSSGPATLPADFQFQASIGASGYQKLPNGLIIQWGEITSAGTAANNATATFPIAFPTAGLAGWGSVRGSGGTLGNFTVQIGSPTTTTLPMTTLLASSITTLVGVNYMAVGY